MKVLLISNMYPSDDYPAFGVFVKNFEKKLFERGFVFEKVVIRGKSQSLRKKVVNYLSFILNARKALMNNEHYDLIYVHYMGHSLLPFLFLKRKDNLIINAHGTDVFPVSIVGKLIQKIITPIIKKATLLVVPSAYFKSVLHEKFKIDKRLIYVSPSGGVDLKLFKDLSTPDDIKYSIGYVSRIDEGKGWNVLLKAIKKIQDRNVRIISLIIGSGNQEELLREMIDNLQLSGYVHYIGGVSHEELSHFYNKIRLFVFPSEKNESLGLVGLEAMACGVPVVGSSIGGIKGYVKPGFNGELFTPGDYNELADNIEKFISMSEKIYLQYKNNALNTAMQYDAEKVADDLAKRLVKLVRNK